MGNSHEIIKINIKNTHTGTVYKMEIAAALVHAGISLSSNFGNLLEISADQVSCFPVYKVKDQHKYDILKGDLQILFEYVCCGNIADFYWTCKIMKSHQPSEIFCM